MIRISLATIALLIVSYITGQHLQQERLAPAAHITQTHTAPEWTHMLPQTMRHLCGQEDENNCYWDAQNEGNGQGHSYIVRQMPGKAHMVCVMYVWAPYAKYHDYCEAMNKF